MQLLLVDPQRTLAPEFARQLAAAPWELVCADSYRAAAELAQQGRVDAVLLAAPLDAEGEGRGGFERLLRALDGQRVSGVVLDSGTSALTAGDESLIDVVPRTVTIDEVRGRLAMIARFQGALKGMEHDLANMQRLGKRLNQHFAEVDQEMRLAGRLQTDFLPQPVEPIGPVRFATLYRPASWVSGDIYDIMRVDESHVAFYVADAVGHGMAASLLTMFIKKAVTAKRISAAGYELLDPSQTMALLNDALTDQTLPNCQFVTACYCLLNLETLVMTFARGGHPYPLLIDRDGTLTDLKTQGALLGLFRGEVFPSQQVQLRPGEKVILYTDGLEVAYSPPKYEKDPVRYHRAVFGNMGHLPVATMLRGLNVEINDEAGSLHPRDDVTVVAMEIAEAPPA